MLADESNYSHVLGPAVAVIDAVCDDLDGDRREEATEYRDVIASVVDGE